MPENYQLSKRICSRKTDIQNRFAFHIVSVQTDHAVCMRVSLIASCSGVEDIPGKPYSRTSSLKTNSKMLDNQACSPKNAIMIFAVLAAPPSLVLSGF